jgi:hypothetical protein
MPVLRGNGSVDTSTRLQAQTAPPTPRERLAARVVAVIEHRHNESAVLVPDPEPTTEVPLPGSRGFRRGGIPRQQPGRS